MIVERKRKGHKLEWGWTWVNNLFRTSKKCKKVGHKWRFYDRRTDRVEQARFICARCERVEDKNFKGGKNTAMFYLQNFSDEDYTCEQTTLSRLYVGMINKMYRYSVSITRLLCGWLLRPIKPVLPAPRVVLKRDL